MTTPIMILVREIKDEAENAIINFSTMNCKTNSQKIKRIANDSYVDSVRKINMLSHAIEKLNQA